MGPMRVALRFVTELQANGLTLRTESKGSNFMAPLR